MLFLFRRFLRHQYNVQLNRRAQQIQEELVSGETAGVLSPLRAMFPLLSEK